MNTFLEFITVFCSGAMLFGGIYMLKPQGAASKSVKYVFAMIFLCIVISAVLNIKIDNISQIENASGFSVDNKALSEYFLIQTFEEALRTENINFSKITVCTNKTESGSITISKVTVYSNDGAERIKEILGGNNAEYEIEVIYE